MGKAWLAVLLSLNMPGIPKVVTRMVCNNSFPVTTVACTVQQRDQYSDPLSIKCRGTLVSGGHPRHQNYACPCSAATDASSISLTCVKNQVYALPSSDIRHFHRLIIAKMAVNQLRGSEMVSKRAHRIIGAAHELEITAMDSDDTVCSIKTRVATLTVIL